MTLCQDEKIITFTKLGSWRNTHCINTVNTRRVIMFYVLGRDTNRSRS